MVDRLRHPPGAPTRRLGSDLVWEPIPPPDVVLVVDYTGCGRPVFDMLVAAELDCTLVPVTITGGDKVIYDGQTGYRVPKRP